MIGCQIKDASRGPQDWSCVKEGETLPNSSPKHAPVSSLVHFLSNKENVTRADRLHWELNDFL